MGAQCRCHEAERRAGTSVVCGKLSRRLHEAGANAVFLARVDSHERLLNLDEAEGDQALLLKALTIVRRFSRMPPPRRSGSQRFHVAS